MAGKTWRVDPLVWGHGPRAFEVLLKPIRLFSARAFGKLDDLAQAGTDRIVSMCRRRS